MMRINIVLLLALVLSGLYLVGVQYESRRVFTDLDRARSEARRLEAESERLQVQKRAAATPVRVERLAKDKLQMHQTNPGITTYVAYAGSAETNTASASVAASKSEAAR
jgi:cell division protein FtsL